MGLQGYPAGDPSATTLPANPMTQSLPGLPATGHRLRLRPVAGVVLLASVALFQGCTTPAPGGRAGPAGALPATVPWPGPAAVEPAGVAGFFGGNLSGLSYQGAGDDGPAVLWAVRNGPSTLFRLVAEGSLWVADTTQGWGNGKTLRYPDGTGEPDAEGVTAVGNALYVASERNDARGGVSRNSILRFEVGGADETLVATHEWDLTARIPPTGPNLGIEAITFVPDSFLVASGFVDQGTGRGYDPSAHPRSSGGVFLVGVEATGTVHAFVLDHGGGSTGVADIESGFPSVMALDFDRDEGVLRAVCDDGCDGRHALLEVDPGSGRFIVTRVVERPRSMPNLNNEGFAVAPRRECTGGVRPVYWADDGEAGGHSLRRGWLTCGAP